MTQSTDDQTSELHQYVALLRARKWSILAVTTLVVVSALIVSFQQTPIYRSQVSILVNVASSTAISGQPPAVVTNLETERRLAISIPVAERVATSLGIDDEPRELLETLSADVEEETEILILAAEHPRPEEAQRRADAFADAYLSERREQIIDGLLDASEGLRERLAELNTNLAVLTDELARTTGRGRRAAVTAKINSLVGQIALLEQRLSDLAPAGSLSVGRIVEPATDPESPVRPKHLVNGLLALFLGLGFGLGVAVVRERLDVRLRGREDLEARAGAAVLGVVPRVSGDSDERTPTILTEPMSPAAEAYRAIRTSVLFAASERGARSILVTSPERGEGKTTTAANLGIALAQAGRRVILVSADLRRPRLHEYFGASNRVGLSSVLAGETAPGQAVVETSVERLRLFPSGPLPGNPTELLGSEAMRILMKSLREASDFVVIDATPILPVADTMALAPLADAVLLVADASRTSRMAVTRARQQLDQVQARLVGAVLNNFDPRAGTYPYYTDTYHGYEPETSGGRLSRWLRRGKPAEEPTVVSPPKVPRTRREPVGRAPAPKPRIQDPSRTSGRSPAQVPPAASKPSEPADASPARPSSDGQPEPTKSRPQPTPAGSGTPAGPPRVPRTRWTRPRPSGRPIRAPGFPENPFPVKPVEPQPRPPVSGPPQRPTPPRVEPEPSDKEDGPRPNERTGPPWPRAGDRGGSGPDDGRPE